MIYIVFGKTGEYSDRSEWLVAAYTEEADAKLHVEKATEYANAWHAFSKSDEFMDLEWVDRQDREKAANPMDSAFSCDYTGTQYWYSPIELQTKFAAPEVIQ